MDIRTGRPAIVLRVVQCRVLVRSDHNRAAILQPHRRSQFKAKCRAGENRQGSAGGAIGGTDGASKHSGLDCRLPRTLACRDTLKQVVGENAAAGQTGPAFFIAAVVVDLGRRLRPGVCVDGVKCKWNC